MAKEITKSTPPPNKEKCAPVCKTNPVSIPVPVQAASGGGKARGVGAATKGTKFHGTY